MRIVSDLFLYPIIKFLILRDTLRDTLKDILSNILSNTLSNILGNSLSAILGITLGIMVSDTPHYENVPYDLPEGWEWQKLGDIGTWQSGATPSRLNKDYYGGDIPWLKTGDLNDDYIYEIPETITQKALEETSVKLNPAGSVLIAMYGATIGKVGILTFPATTNQACCACVDYQGIEKMYLFYFLLSHKEEFIMLGGGGAQPNISKEKIVDTFIPIPPLLEQNRIVNAIEQWFYLIDTLETAKEDLKTSIEHAKSKILDLAIHGKLVPQDSNDEPAIELLKRINPKFTPCDNAHYENVPFEIPKSWRWTCMAEVNEYNSASVDPSKSPNNDFELYSVPAYETGMPEFVKGKDISSSKKSVSKNDVLLCKINPHLNRAWIVSHYKENMPCLASSEWIIFRNSSIIPQYLSFCFTSKYFKELMLSNVSGVGGSLMRAQPAIVNKYLFPLPPINEQCRIVAAIQEYYEILDNMSANL